MLPSVRVVKPPNTLAWKQISTWSLQGRLSGRSKGYWICDHAKHLHSSARVQFEHVHWTQKQLNSLRDLFAQGKRIDDVAAALQKTKYSIHAVSCYDSSKQGWWTPERPVDVAGFREKRSAGDNATDVPHPDLRSGLKRKIWTQADRDRAIELLNSGMPMEDIAKALGRSTGAVRTRLNRRQNGPAPKPFSAKEDAEILSLRGHSRSLGELRELMPRRTVEDIRNRAGELGVARCLTAEPWTHEEIVKLWQLRAKGLVFSEIALHLPDRTASACTFKYRYMVENNQQPTIEEIGATPSDMAEKNK